MKRHDISISLLGYDMITKYNIDYVYRLGLYLRYLVEISKTVQWA